VIWPAHWGRADACWHLITRVRSIASEIDDYDSGGGTNTAPVSATTSEDSNNVKCGWRLLARSATPVTRTSYGTHTYGAFSTVG